MKQAVFALVILSVAACERSVDQVTACRLERGCSVNLDGQIISVRSDVAPQAARAFALQVEAAQAEEISAQFEMRGMSMATPNYVLRRRGSRFEANVILPMCVSGRSDWILRLSIDGKPAEFGFSASS